VNRSILLNRAVELGMEAAVQEFLANQESKRSAELKAIRSLRPAQALK
jgi:hypothetical protein